MEKKLTIKWFRSIDSTNLQAHRELDQAGEGTVWVADYQTAGRGQRGNSWESSKGLNLLFTVLLRPDFVKVANQFVISQITALAIVKYLENKGLSPKIKWPNDIYINDRKICGILIEHTLCGDKLSASILGIGVNINQKVFASDAPNPTSLILELQRMAIQKGKLMQEEIEMEAVGEGDERNELDRRVELQQVLAHLFSIYEELCSAAEDAGEEGYNEVAAAINSEYLSYLYRFNQPAQFIETETGTQITATIKGINQYGCLVLEKSGEEKSVGELCEYAFQQIKYII